MISKPLFAVFAILSTTAFSTRLEEDVPYSFLQAEVASEEGASSSYSYVRPSTEVETDYVDIDAGYWGDWLDEHKAPVGFLGCGMQLRDEGGQWGDDTAINAIRIIYCSIANWDVTRDIQLNDGIWGDWEERVMCAKNTYIVGAQAKVEEPQGTGGDDTAFNGLKIKCKNPKVSSSSETVSLEYGGWGTWRAWVEYSSSYVCGGQVRFEEKIKGDNTALNGLRLKFCKYVNVKSVKMEYDFDRMKLNSTPHALDRNILTNDTKVVVTKKFETSQTVTETSTFDNMYGASLGITVTAEVGVPAVAKGSASVSAEMNVEFKRGGSNSKEKKLTKSLEVDVPPCTKSIVTYEANKTSADVPYKAIIKFEDDSVSIVEGTWHGVSYSEDTIKVKHEAITSGGCKEVALK
jgi:hypothetical protein